MMKIKKQNFGFEYFQAKISFNQSLEKICVISFLISIIYTIKAYIINQAQKGIWFIVET